MHNYWLDLSLLIYGCQITKFNLLSFDKHSSKLEYQVFTEVNCLIAKNPLLIEIYRVFLLHIVMKKDPGYVM